MELGTALRFLVKILCSRDLWAQPPDLANLEAGVREGVEINVARPSIGSLPAAEVSSARRDG